MTFIKLYTSGIRFAFSARYCRSFCRVCPLMFVLCCLSSRGDDRRTVELELNHLALPGLHFGSVTPGTYVFRNSSEWKAFWAAHPGPFPEYIGPVPPFVDFDKFAVAAVYAGPKPICRSLNIYKGVVTGSATTLRYRIYNFGMNTPSSCIGIDPGTVNLADLVLIPQTSGEVHFQED
jgi:hypothetical protein